jgi:DNA-binding response OmpR family regulator
MRSLFPYHTAVWRDHMTQRRTEKILVVDDEETMRRSLSDILRLEGYPVKMAHSGEAAVQALKTEPFDLMLLDLKMPGMDGLEVLQYAAQIAPETKVILLTAHGSLESAISALRHEVYDYLLKPSSPQQILSTVTGALARRAEERRQQMLLTQMERQVIPPDSPSGSQNRRTEPLVVQIGRGIKVHFSRRELWEVNGPGNGPENGRKVILTPGECKLLRVLLERRGEVISHRELVQLVQGYSVHDWEAPEVLRPLVSRLRQKLAVFPGGDKWITNIRGTGYLFELFD